LLFTSYSVLQNKTKSGRVVKSRLHFVPTMGAAKYWCEEDPSKKKLPPIVLKKGNLAGTLLDSNDFFGLPAPTAKKIDSAAKELDTWQHSMRVFMDSKMMLFEECKSIEKMIDYSLFDGTDRFVLGGGHGARTFGYRVVALGVHLLIHGSGDQSEELAHLSRTLYDMKDIPKEKMGKYIFHLSRAMEEGLHEVDERTFKDIFPNEEDEEMSPGDGETSDEGTDNDGNDSDATEPMSPDPRIQNGDEGSVDF
jgi:hypothetical protein